jgi:hypothetical protein
MVRIGQTRRWHGCRSGGVRWHWGQSGGWGL